MKPAASDDPAFLFELTNVEPLSAQAFATDADFANSQALVKRAAARVGAEPEHLVGVRYRVRYMMAPMSMVVTRELPAAAGKT